MTELAKSYDPGSVETKWYAFWEKEGFFQADALSSKPPFTIAIPPPNVTGALHMGHALVNTLQDILIRWKRMSGYEALWVPGTDHAGIATQTVVERDLMKTTGKRRCDFSREEFLAFIWKWKEESERSILSQLKRLGASCDWSRLCFTLDEKRSRAVRTVFKKMFDDGLIYQGDYLVNWDPITQTALADDEVEYEERSGSLWYLRYPLEGSGSHLVIATTRPETLLGDTALAVSPKDERYLHLVGKRALLPLLNRPLPIIEDPLVDPAFGTGVVKVTPAHDPNDYEMAQRHNLPLINILTPDGKINENGGAFAGLTREEARAAVVKKMESLHLVEKVEPHLLRVGLSYRSKAVIEPYLSKQWFVRMAPFKKKLRSAVEEKRVTLLPKGWEETYFHWIDHLRDWCISRQLWWGHRIPIWYKKEDPQTMICFSGEGPLPEAQKEKDAWVQDEDVLDTWFSSALWPFSIFGWPQESADLKKFYPTSTLITGHDILFFWVARMILMGEYVLHQPPFSTTFLHGLIYGKSYWRYGSDGSAVYLSAKERLDYDLGKSVPSEIHSKWEKMSKSKGNILNPLEIIDSYGADAMRMALASSVTGARQIDLDRRRFEEFKNFANKIWNGARFVLMNIKTLTPQSAAQGLFVKALRLEDCWILSLLNRTTIALNHHLSSYAFDRAALCAYDFFWKEFCSDYVEICKPFLFGKVGSEDERLNKQKILLILLTSVIRLLHPMAPFITEELFQLLKIEYGGMQASPEADDPTQETFSALAARACIVAPYPRSFKLEALDESVEREFEQVSDIVRTVRNIRAEMALPLPMECDLILVGSPQETALFLKNEKIVRALVKLGTVQIREKEERLPFSASSFSNNLKVIVLLPEEMREKERLRLMKGRDKLIFKENELRQRLSRPDFVAKAPPSLVEKTKEELAKTAKELLDLSSKLDALLY